mmetsp:Transcript_5588/g.10034  ORF Transcript_5588/g.10034 Transcript_5588/m.10034 type:complete len:104 (+) Transcript_5588:167-478(+)
MTIAARKAMSVTGTKKCVTAFWTVLNLEAVRRKVPMPVANNALERKEWLSIIDDKSPIDDDDSIELSAFSNALVAVSISIMPVPALPTILSILSPLISNSLMS